MKAIKIICAIIMFAMAFFFLICGQYEELLKWPSVINMGAVVIYDLLYIFKQKSGTANETIEQ